MEIRKALAIAGSDPSGGAGIQADLKTFSALGVYGAAVVTCLTVQNTQKVFDSLSLPGDFVREQILAVLDDLDVFHVKIGMLGNAEIARSVGVTLEEWKQKAGHSGEIVCDPVMISKSGYALMKEDAMQAVADYVLSVSTVLTPNAHELEKIAGMIGSPPVSPVKSAEFILEHFDNLKAVLVKGGHLDETGKESVDTLVMRHGGGFRNLSFAHPRIDTLNTHGTGCTLSSALTANLALGMDLAEAAEKAVNYVACLIAVSAQNRVGKGNGSLIHYLGKLS